jgi:hypothetical protein
MSSYVFILCPPFSGSTVLWKLFSTSHAVSALPSEGQFLPEVKNIMRQDPWNPDIRFPWEEIKAVWDGYWDHEKPLLVEKSPPHIIRTQEIMEHFRPVSFILMVRNPYAHCEGLIRRNKWSATDSAKFSVRCMREQADNAKRLPNTLCFTYEQLTENPEMISKNIQEFLPELGELKHTESFSVHSIDGVVNRRIVNLNKSNIENLSVRDLRDINKVLRENDDVMTYWGYAYQKPTWQHAMRSLVKRSKSMRSNLSWKCRRLLGRFKRRLIPPSQ